MQKHVFALFVRGFDGLLRPRCVGDRCIITDDEAVLRITSILRMAVGDTVILFDTAIHIKAQILSIHKKKSVEFVVEEIHPNVVQTPHITAMVPLLKRDETDEMIYGLAEVGVNIIQLIKTDRVQRSWGGEKEMNRLRRVIVSAAEQSKCFSFPLLVEPYDLFTAISHARTPLFVGDPCGKSLYSILNGLNQKTDDIQYTILVGPEGDFSATEKQLLHDKGAQGVGLTPTILRASHAAIIFSALIRTFHN